LFFILIVENVAMAKFKKRISQKISEKSIDASTLHQHQWRSKSLTPSGNPEFEQMFQCDCQAFIYCINPLKT